MKSLQRIGRNTPVALLLALAISAAPVAAQSSAKSSADAPRFESNPSMIAKLPTGYQMFDGKFEKIAVSPAPEIQTGAPPDGYVHIVRTERWEDAHDNPITRSDVEGLIASDHDLAWSPSEWHGMSESDRNVQRGYSILWKGAPGFQWRREEIRCAAPTEQQLAKMIEMAIALDANVIGDDGEELH